MATITWTGAAGDNNFSNPANWNPQQVPGAADAAVIKVSSPLTLAVNQDVGQLVTSANVTLTVGDYNTLEIGNGGTTTAALTNGGVILLNGGHDTGLVLNQSRVLLSGGGHIELADQSIVGAASGDSLANVDNLISGSGDIGNGTLALTNGAKGVIDANLSGSQLVVNTGSLTASNLGLMEATSGGVLTLASAVSNAGATITAAGGTVLLAGGDIQGGLLSASAGGTVQISGSGTLDGTAHMVTSTGYVEVDDYASLSLLGTISNAGTIHGDYVHGAGIIIGQQSGVAGTVTLTGSGTVMLSDALQAGQAGDVLNNVNNTINGYDELGNGTALLLINGASGVINANLTSGIDLNTGTATTLNSGLIEATNTGGLTINSAIDDSSGGIISGAGGNVYLSEGSRVIGGMLTDSNSGKIVVDSGQTLTVLDGTAKTVTSTAYIEIQDYGGVVVLGTLSNGGTIHQDYVHGAGFVAGPQTGAIGTATLTGGGTVTIGGQLVAGQAGDTLYNVNNLIDGAGQLGNGSALVLINGAGGVIDADNGGGLEVNTGTATLLNSGLIESTSTGGLFVDTTIDNGASGTLAAAGGSVVLRDGSIIEGGTVSGSNGGRLIVSSGQTFAVLDGLKNVITSTAYIEVQDYGGLVIEGSFVNDGTIEKDYVHGPGILIAGNTTFTNMGTLVSQFGYVVGNTSAVLTNDSKGILTGGTYDAAGGTIAFGGVAVSTLGTGTALDIGSGGALVIGGIDITQSLRSVGAGAALEISGSETFAHGISNSGTLLLDGGVLSANTVVNAAGASFGGTGVFAASFAGTQTIAVGNGELDLTGATTSISGTVTGSSASTIGFGGATTLAKGSVLAIGNVAVLNNDKLGLGQTVSFAGTFNIEGNATISGGAITTAGVFEESGGGTATIAQAVTSSGTIVTNYGTLAFNGGLTGTKSVIIDNAGLTDTKALQGGTLTVNGFASLGTAANGAADSLRVLNVQSGALNTNGARLTVSGDYNNTAAGTGNSYNPFAGVTGTINALGTKLSVVGVNGTTVTSANGTYTIAVASGGSASFEIKNAGVAASTMLRGALQTSVNGGSITGTALSGSGVTAGNFGPLAGGAVSGVYTIDYSGGGLSGEAIHIASDFANVAGITIDIVDKAAPGVSHAAGWPVEHGDFGLMDFAVLHH